MKKICKSLFFLSLIGLAFSNTLAGNIAGNFVYEDGLAVYRPLIVSWQNINDQVSSKYYSIFQMATLSIKVNKCKHSSIPIRAIYVTTDKNRAIGGNDGYYILDGSTDAVVQLKVFETKGKLEFADIPASRFDRLEIDPVFTRCFGEIQQTSVTQSFSMLNARPKGKSSAPRVQDIQSDGIPIYFNKRHVPELIQIKDSAYKLKALIRPAVKLEEEQGFKSICDRVKMTSPFEKDILGRAITCGIIVDLADLENHAVKRGVIIRVSGYVSAGAVTLTITRNQGGILKISNLPKGKILEEYVIPVDGIYKISLTSNLSVYNYPLLDFTISMVEFTEK
jgi:hypothetical protein